MRGDMSKLKEYFLAVGLQLSSIFDRMKKFLISNENMDDHPNANFAKTNEVE